VNRRLLAALLLVLACAKKTNVPRPLEPDKPIDDSAERASLVSLPRGSCVVSRTGEAMLDLSALRAVDSDPVSFWEPPPKDVPQSVVIALPARSMIRRVGFRTTASAYTAHQVKFETSLDGAVFQPLATVTSAATGDPQWFTVPSTTTALLRVTMLDLATSGRDPRLYSILADGTEQEPPHPGSIEGTWSINGVPAIFSQHGDRVAGILFLGKEPIRLEGGSDGRLYRLAWVRGNDYGLAAITVSPDGKHLSGIEWHEEAIPLFYGDSWFGERGESDAPAPESIAIPHLKRVGRFPLFAVDVDELANIIKTAPMPLRLVAHQFRERDDAQNLARAQRELASLQQALAGRGIKIDGVAAGAANPRQTPVSEIMRAMYSSIDLEIRR
jgi:hypothetical protein